jgi:hypothetical protein
MYATDTKQLSLYASLMDEVKVRFVAVVHATNGRTGLPAPIVREFCHQQIRFLCELTALACLVAHGDIQSLQSHKIGRSTSADEIITRLERLRPHFYPMAISLELIGEENVKHRHHNIRFIENSPLSKQSLITLYAKTHQFLHRGSLKRMLSSSETWDTKIDLPEIIGTVQKFSDLLGHHLIAISEDKVMVCTLSNRENSDRVQVIFAGRPP